MIIAEEMLVDVDVVEPSRVHQLVNDRRVTTVEFRTRVKITHGRSNARKEARNERSEISSMANLGSIESR